MSGTTYTISNGYDAQVDSLFATKSFPGWVFIGLNASSDLGYVYLPFPNIAGQTVASATLTGHTYTSNLSQTVTVKRVSGAWAEGNITYNRQPSVVATSYNTSVPATSVGDAVNLDVTTIMQTVSSGAAYFGFQLSSSGTIDFAAFESGLPAWTLTIVTTDAPEVPQSLVPNGTVVGSGAPVLTCDFVDNGGLTNDMASMNVQVNATNVWTSPTYDQTGTTTVPVFNLASPPPGASAFTAISSGSTRFWRVRVQDSDGNWSGWSDAATFTFRTQSAITILTPASGVVWDPTTDIVATFGSNLSAYRVQITDGTDRTAIRFDSGRLPANPSALTTIDVPLPQEYEGSRVLVDDSVYQLHIQAWDTFTSRQSTPGQPSYVESWTTFTFDDDSGVAAPDTLVADQGSDGPAVTLTWTRGAAPDAWVVLRDSKVIARLDGTDVISGVSTYSWDDPHPVPWVNHDYTVKAIDGGHQSQPSPTASITPGLEGIWLYTQDGQQVQIDGNAVDQLVVNDRRTTYKPINVRYDVDIVTGFEGLSGTFSGTIQSDDDRDVSDAIAVLLSIKEHPGQWVRMVYGRFSGRVLLRNVSVTPNAAANVVNQAMTVSFGVNQVGHFDTVI